MNPRKLLAEKSRKMPFVDGSGTSPGGEGMGTESPLPDLRAALWVHQENQHTATRQPRAASAVSTDLPEIQALLGRVTSAFRQVESLSRRPEQALELAVRQTSRAAVYAAMSLLPDPIRTPMRFVVSAAEHVLGIGPDLGR
jgi:hypothetical protein